MLSSRLEHCVVAKPLKRTPIPELALQLSHSLLSVTGKNQDLTDQVTTTAVIRQIVAILQLVVKRPNSDVNNPTHLRVLYTSMLAYLLQEVLMRFFVAWQADL